MDENLVGYLLKSLGAEEQRAVEDHLRRHPEAKERLEQLRRGLDLLGADGGEPEPPPDLWVRTLARVAEYKCRTLPAVPAPAARTAPVAWGSWWRRADVLVAACLLLLVGGLGVIGMAAIAAQRHVTECQDNLRKFHQALTAYADKHEDRFPWVESQAPKNFAGSFIPALNEDGVLPSDITVSCPGNEPRAPAPVTFAQLEEMRRSHPGDYIGMTRTLAGCYAYSLGYREGEAGPHYGLTRRMDGRLPIMADAPPCRSANEVEPGNSLNHGGKGQNVLFIDGHVEFLTTRTVPGTDDDMYLNAERRVAAGRGPGDVVLGRSDAVLDE
jgi:prepilin-type processing-associated H-X9-DG protein